MFRFRTSTVVCAVAVVATLPSVARAQLHGLSVAKGCEGPVCVGEEVVCDVQFGYNDGFGDTLRIHGAWDVQDFLGAQVRIPAIGAEVIGDTFSDGTMIGNDDGVCDPFEACAGNLVILSASGNTTCVAGGPLPCEIGPGGSVNAGLPGDPEPGVVTFQSSGYFVQPDDSSTLRDQANVLWEDLCDDENTSNCGQGIMNIAQAPGAIGVTRCDDGDPCTTDTCSAGECTFTPECVTDADCDDGNACSVNTCVAGCCEEEPLVCDDNDVCTDDSCDEATGCVYEDNSSRCDDGNACTSDSCDPIDGCVNEDISSQCDDGNACTADSCDPETGCVNEDTSDQCDDGNACTADSCDPETGCVSTDISDECDDNNACTNDSCDPATGCVNDDISDECDDNDVCTDDSCDPELGCVYEDNSSRCDDNDVCTDDSCDPTDGCVNEDNSSRCDDGNDCTTDSCDPTDGCVNVPDCMTDADCDDGNACTTNICVEGCCEETPIVCDDQDPCTDDSCDPETGCVFTDKVCDDEDDCTTDECVDGTCVFTTIEPPPDGCFSALACRMTGGGVDTSDTRVTRSSKEEGSLAEGEGQQEPGGRNRYTMGGQAGAPTANQPQPYGEWTHHQQRGRNGKFVFHAGTASAPRNTEIDEIVCTDPDWCVQARPAPAKQIDFQGVGSFRNADSKAKSSLEDLSGGVEIIPGESLHWFHVHVEDLGEPGRAGKVDPPADICPPEGSYGMLADCDCPDYYEIQIHATSDPSSPIIYDVYGYITGGNLQIHPPID